MAKRTICMDIGGSKILGCVMDDNNKILARVKKKTKPELGRDAVDKRIQDVVRELMEKEKLSTGDICAVAAGAPGVIDTDKGTILYSPNIPWKDHCIGKVMEEALGMPFYIGNDVNVGILGEWKYGAAAGYANVVGLFVGTGIGGGVVIDNRLFTGSNWLGAELGHMIVNPEGPWCNCGQRGCLEAYASKIGMTKEMRSQIQRGAKSNLLDEMEGEDAVFRSNALQKAYREKDPVAVSTLRRAVRYLAVGAGNLINIFNPEVFVLGGGVVESLESEILELFMQEIDQYAWPAMLRQVKIVPSALRDDAILYGAQAMIAQMGR